ncbi:hypothetical protein IM774_12505 [Erysipelotrichaceae bacterium RD49]|nr:hypothetical protein [Erysipelotrichaceae bacterium RD49]
MSSVLIKTSGYLIIIALGYLLRSLSVFSKQEAKLLGNLIVKVTLPAALIRNAASIVIGPELPLLFCIGVMASCITLYAGYILAGRKREPRTSAFMLTVSTFNLGAFLMPFVELFFPGTGVGYLCMFDTGNAIMGLGISYALAKVASGPNEPLTFNRIAKTLLKSVPFMTYVVLFGLAACSIPIPQIVLDYAETIGSANAFLTMFMIGLMIDFHLPKKEVKEIMMVCITRFALVIVMSVIIWLIPGMSPLMKLIAILCLFSPVASAATPYSIECGYQGDLVGMVSTITMVLSVLSILVIVSFLQTMGLL